MKCRHHFKKKNRHLLYHAFELTFPIAAVLALAVSFYFVFDYRTFLNALSMVSLELFSPFSIEVSAPFGAVIGLDIFTIFFVLTFVNIFSTIFILWNFDLIRHLPVIGRFLDKFDKKVLKIIRKHNLEHLSLFGLFLWFLSPFHASGSTTIAVVGKLLNIQDKKILAVVVIGTITGIIIFSGPIYGLKSLF